MDIGKRIKEIREKRGMQQLELANKIKISQSKMNKIETGYQKKLEPEILNNIAKALGVTVDSLLNNTKESSTEEQISIMFRDGGESLTKDELEHVEEALKQYRKLKERFMKEKKRGD
ncbi:helix-turn-helix transcriptional regulator [Bacillaceae bacterium Marseille-Q3522]|nr:helix-turn-helix transcriptional regulator [Bacillaceae bacterium Marseille-Q3522]